MIRRALWKDIPEINNLLYQVVNVHAKLRPDFFVTGTKKYTDDELKEIISDDNRPIFVYTNEYDKAVGYAFCILQEVNGVNVCSAKELYIDDICVDEQYRGKHIATMLYEYVVEYGRKNHIDRITLNVWEGNDSARRFYEKMGMRPRKTMLEQIL